VLISRNESALGFVNRWCTPFCFRFPNLEKSPCGECAAVPDCAIQHHFFEFSNRHGLDPKILFLVVPVVWARGEPGGKEHVEGLTHEAVGEPEGSEMCHLGRGEAGFLAKFAACELLGIDGFGFPAALRQFENAFANRVPELFDQPDAAAIDREDYGPGMLVDDAIDTILTVRAQDLVFAETKPFVAIDLT